MNSFWKRLAVAFSCFFSIIIHGSVPREVIGEVDKPADLPTQTPPVSVPATASQTERQRSETFDRAVQMLALMQRDGRLIDFLSEGISEYPDAQLGAAVRTIHESCRAALNQYVTLEPVLNFEENQPVTLQPGFDADAIKLVGNIVGGPPIRGVLRHKGWRVKQVSLPPLPNGTGRAVVAPAEVEVP